MSKVAIITDTHFGARADSTQMQQSMLKFYNNIFFPALDQYEVTQVLHGGDYVDRRKYINFQTANFITTHYRAPLRHRDLHETILVGNHDCFLRHTTDINAVEELFALDSSITTIKRPMELDVDGCGLLMLPWICDANRDDALDLIQKTSATIALGHLELQGFQMYKGMPSNEGLNAQLFDRFTLVMSGHFHHRSYNPPINYLGAPYPMIWSDYNDPRGFHIFDTETYNLTFIENPYSLFARLIYDDAEQTREYPGELIRTISEPNSPYHQAYVKVVVKSKENPFWFDLVLDAVGKIAYEVVVVDDIIVNDNEDAIETSADVDTPTILREYVESLAINCDKNELDNYMQSLYHEALASTQSARLT